MTFRAKPVVKRAHRPAWEAQDRRNFYLNVGFGLIVLLALLILGIAVGLSYYNDHLASVGSVNGQSISKDELRDRAKIESWRLDESERRVRTAVLAGHLTEAQGSSAESTITDQKNNVASIALERIIDTKLQASLAAQEGVSAAPADVDAKLQDEATTPETRHVWMIEVAPVTDAGAVEPTATQKADAKAKAEAALKDIQGGKAWEDVAKTVSTDTATAPQAGDLGWLAADDSQTDEAFLTAVFAAPANTPTAVVEGADGIFRIGRVTEIVPTAVDDAYQAKIQNDKIDLAQYRAVLAGDVIHEKLSAKIVADVTGPGPQRQVSEIYIKAPQTPPPADAIKVRHILYSPNGDPSGAANVAADRPRLGGGAPEGASRRTSASRPTRSCSTRSRAPRATRRQAKGPAGTGGKLPYFDSTSRSIPSSSRRSSPRASSPATSSPPVKSAFGWHVIQVMNKPPDTDAHGRAQDEGRRGRRLRRARP